MKFECHRINFSWSYRLGPQGIHSLFSYRNAAKNWESFNQACTDDDLFMYDYVFPIKKKGWQAKCKQNDVPIQDSDWLLRKPFECLCYVPPHLDIVNYHILQFQLTRFFDSYQKLE